jgi:hypothetical protein
MAATEQGPSIDLEGKYEVKAPTGDKFLEI